MNPLARNELLSSGANDPSALKQAPIKAEALTPENVQPFCIRDRKAVDSACIASVCDGVRSTQAKAEWAGDSVGKL